MTIQEITHNKFAHVLKVVSSESFLKMDALGGEIPFWIAPYDIEAHDQVEVEIKNLQTKLANTGIKTELNSKKVMANNQESLTQVQSKQTNAENLAANFQALSNDKTLPTEAQRLYLSTYNSWSRTLKTLTSYKNQVSQRIQRISDSQALVNKAAEEFLAQQTVVNKTNPILKKNTITCIKGKLTKKVTAVNPKCPAGYKKK